MQEISDRTDWSYKQVVYWMQKYNIPRRSRSEANYIKYNPKGNPFYIKKNLTREEKELKGLGLGLYWGEGHRRSKWSIKLGNTDPELIKKFIEFLMKICGVKEEKIKYALQVFNDADPKTALNFWTQELKISKKKIGKISALPSRGKGTYKRKNQHGVFSVYVHNIKLKNKFDEWIKRYKVNMPG